MAKAHTDRFLQTFHTAMTQAQRTAASQTDVPTDHADTDPAALAFVRGHRNDAPATRPARNDGSYEATIKGHKVRCGAAYVSEAQASWMIDIATTRLLPAGRTAEQVLVRLEQGFAKSAGSQFITQYKDLPRVTAAMVEAIAPTADESEIRETKPATEVEADGIYVDDSTGRIFKVQFNRAQGSGQRLYAKQLVIILEFGDFSTGLLHLDLGDAQRDEISIGRSWEYRPGLIRQIKPEWKLNPEQAETYGKLYGACIRCGRDLTKESSIRQSMGDTCASKSGF